MFFIFCKEKIVSYAIALSTVIILLCISAINYKAPETLQTSSNTMDTKTEKRIIQGE